MDTAQPAPSAIDDLALPCLGRANLRDEVAASLEEKILSGAYPVGGRLPIESELATRFSISRTVVRDALRLLEARGLIEVRRGVGTTVREVSPHAYRAAAALTLIRSDLTVRDVFEARSILEGQLALVAGANHTLQHVERMEFAFDNFDRAVESGGHAAIVEAHVDFHTELLRSANLPALDILIGPVQSLMLASSVTAEDDGASNREAWRVDVHRGLLDAILSRDSEAITRASQVHWGSVIEGQTYRQIGEMRIGELFRMPEELLSFGHTSRQRVAGASSIEPEALG